MSIHSGATLTTDGWLTLAEAAQVLGVSVHSVRRRVKAGQLVARQVPTDRGPAWRVALHPDAHPGHRRGQGDAHPGATVTNGSHVAHLLQDRSADPLEGWPVRCDDALAAGPHPGATVASGLGQGDDTLAEPPGLVELVRLVRELQADVIARTEAATLWQGRAEMLAAQLEQTRELVRALAPPDPPTGQAAPGPVPDPFPVPTPRTPNAEPSRWRRWWLALAGAGLALAVGASCQQASATKHAGLCTMARKSMNDLADVVGDPMGFYRAAPGVDSLLTVAEKVC